MAGSMPDIALQLVDESRQEEVRVTHSPFTIGRLQDRDLVLPHPFISRDHAAVIYEGGDFYIVDRGSRHGTFVNNQALVEPHKLQQGDQIRLGSLQGPSLSFGHTATTGESTSTIHKLLEEPQEIAAPRSDLEKLSWFLHAAARLNTLGGVNDILATLVETTLELTQVERGYVFLREGDKDLKLAVGRSFKGARLEDDSTISHSVIAQASCSASKFIVTDTLSAEAGSRSESMVQQSIRTIYCIPLRKRSISGTVTTHDERDVLGVLYLDSRLQPGKLTQVDNDLLDTIATEAAALVQNAVLVHAEEAARRYQEEMNFAAAIQQGLMAGAIPRLPYARIHARSIPCKEVGGDFYDIIETDNGLYVIIADIAGKGVSAAILASNLQGLLYGQVLAGHPLGQMAELANRYICAKNIQKHATMVLLRLAPDGTLEYINCGHVQPLLIGNQGVQRLENANMLVGLIEEATFCADTLRINPGERLILATDGITEAESSDGEFYGEERLEVACANADVDTILKEVEAFMKGAPPNDDYTMLEITYTS
jgi:phosphoserine phosphatase RsbU/P